MCAMHIDEAFRKAGAISIVTSLAKRGTEQERIYAVSTLCNFVIDYDKHYSYFPDEERDLKLGMAKVFLDAGAIDVLAASIGLEDEIDEIDAEIGTALIVLAGTRLKPVLAAILKSNMSLQLLNRLAKDENHKGAMRPDATKKVLWLLAVEKNRKSVRAYSYRSNVLQ